MLPLDSVMLLMNLSSLTLMNVPCFKVTPVKPIALIRLAPASSKQAETTASALITKP
jgi:hypothetical protein